MGDLPNAQHNSVIVEGSTGNDLEPNSDGSVNVVVIDNPAIPSGATGVNQEYFGSIATTSGDNQFYVITNLKTLIIQTFFGGAESSQSGSVVELFFDVNGNLSVLVRIRTIWVDGASFSVGVNQDFIGNGTARMVMRRRGYSGSGREMEVAFSGYEETT